MNFLVDECFPFRLVQALRGRGHDVAWASEVCRSEPDEIVLAFATSESRIVITEDRDFGKLTLHHGHAACGIVILYANLFSGGITEATKAAVDAIEASESKLLGALTTVEPGRIRQRPLLKKQP